MTGSVTKPGSVVDNLHVTEDQSIIFSETSTSTNPCRWCAPQRFSVTLVWLGFP